MTVQAGKSVPTPTLRNLKKSAAELQKILMAKISTSNLKRHAQSNEVDDEYKWMNITKEDIPNLISFLNLLKDVPRDSFRKLILDAKVLDTSNAFSDARSAATEVKTAEPLVSGVIKFEGTPPKRKHVHMDEASRKLYDKPPRDENILISKSGEIQNVFVYIKSGLEPKEYPIPKEYKLLDQEKSMFHPRVQGLIVGQTFKSRNSDPYIHNVRSMSRKNRPFNIGQPAKSEDRQKVFKKAEWPIQLQCDFHRWMKAFVFVMDHPFFAVSNKKGQFSIKNLPAGKYTISAWHEEFGEQEKEISVGASGEAKIDFTFKPK